MFPNDIIGEQIEIMLMERDGNLDVHPGWYGHYIPVEIIADYPSFYLCNVLPHVNPINQRNGFKKLSTPYRMTLNKWDIGRKWKVRGLIDNG